ncbi:anks6 [Symbiodinium sp. KB8]|nr:anks6 [Symbiodinium sp. KB8]
MPDDNILHAVERVENPKLWNLYQAHLDAVGEGFPGQPEMWLWHGADDSRRIAHDGFKTAYSNRTFNMYGVGHYFAVDPRMANHFVRSCRDEPERSRTILLCRVVAGVCKTREPITMHVEHCRTQHMGCKFWACRELRAKLLRNPENQQAPAGSHSCTSKNKVEVIVFENHHAYPAYLLEYTCPSLSDFDPYRNLKQLASFDPRAERSNWSVQFKARRALLLGGIGFCGDMAYAETLAEYAKRALPDMVWEQQRCSPPEVCGVLSNFDVVLVCDMYIDLPRKLWSPKLDHALKEFVLKGGFLAFMGGEPLAKERIFKDVFGLSWTFAGETGCDCIKSSMVDLPCMEDAPEWLERRKLMPLSNVPQTERIYPLETFSDSDSDVSDDSDPKPPAESLLCGVALAEHGLGSIVNVGEMQYLYPEFYPKGSEFSWWDALLCLVKGHKPKPALPQALEVALSQGYQTIEDDDAHVIRMEALLDDAFDAVLTANAEKLGGMLRHINPNMADDRGFSLLMMAAQTSEVHVIQLLLNARADIGQTDADNGWTALHYLAESPRASKEAWDFLVAAGSDPQLPSRFGDSPLHLARDNFRLQMRQRQPGGYFIRDF